MTNVHLKMVIKIKYNFVTYGAFEMPNTHGRILVNPKMQSGSSTLVC